MRVVFVFLSVSFLFFSFPNSLVASESLPLVAAHPLKLVADAPPPIAKAARAVVNIEMQMGAGTGFFISADGLLLTNHHVVGPDECPTNGCFLVLRQNWNGKEAGAAATYFVTPEFTVPELDTAVLQVWAAPPLDRSAQATEKLSTPDFLTPASDTRTGEALTVVGHAFAGIQRWSTGILHLVRGDWRAAEILVVPGMSGSPVVNSDGRVVGIAHRSSTDGEAVLDLAQLRHVGIFTAWSAFERVWNTHRSGGLQKPLEGYVTLPINALVDPEALGELMDDVSDFEVLLSLFAARRQESFAIDASKLEDEDASDEEAAEPKPKKRRQKKGANKKKGATFQVRTMLKELCQSEVSSEEAIQEPDYEYPLCQTALDWFDCRQKGSKEPEPPIFGLAAESAEKWEYRFCPTAKEQVAYKQLFKQVEELLELKNQDPLSWVVTYAGVFESTAAAASDATKAAVQAYFANHSGLSILEKAYGVASYATSLDEPVEGSTNLAAVLADYPSNPARAVFYEEVIGSIATLAEAEVLTQTQLSAYVTKVFSLTDVPVADKIDLESVVADAGVKYVTGANNKRNRLNRSSAKVGFLQIRTNTGESQGSGTDLSR
jgi:hypothetical protein